MSGVPARLAVVACALVLLAPFLGRALHIDDPLFAWAAAQARLDPLDPYGFSVNWYGREMPMADVAMNPTLHARFLALGSLVFGTSEGGLHATSLLATLAALLGVHRLARLFGADGTRASLLTLCAPFFFVCATTLMCDVPMLALWLWAMVAWRTALAGAGVGAWLLAVVLVVAAVQTKYAALCLLPLLALQALLLQGRGAGRALAFLALAVCAIAGLEWAGAQVRGHSLLVQAVRYAGERQPGAAAGVLANGWIGLVFLGGGVLGWLTGLVLIRPARLRLGVAAAGAALVFAAGIAVAAGQDLLARALQQALFGIGGCVVVGCACATALRERSADGAVLLAWLLGTLVFACWLNWTVNARALLALVPAWSILLARAPAWPRSGVRALGLFAVPGLVSLVLALADARQAAATRAAAGELVTRYHERARIWFQGHWGFQYYAQALGATPLDFGRSVVQAGDVIVVPPQGTNIRALPATHVRALEVVSYPLGFVTTMSQEQGAGLYTHAWGSMPYVFVPAPPEVFVVLEVTRGFRMTGE